LQRGFAQLFNVVSEFFVDWLCLALLTSKVRTIPGSDSGQFTEFAGEPVTQARQANDPASANDFGKLQLFLRA
jgi:hypothetical protein